MERVKSFFEIILYYLIISAIPLFLIISISISIYQYYSQVPRENIKETIGVVLGYEEYYKGSAPAKVYFQHNNKVYKTNISEDFVCCEKFIVEYEQDNPKANRVRLDKPVFLKGEDASVTVGYLETYNTNYFKIISYTYYVDCVKYEKSYDPIVNSDLKYPNAKEGYNYIVKYWNFNPQRSVILLDKKTDKSLYDIK